MKYYCLVCGEEFEVYGFEQCPHCYSVGDDLEPIEDIDDMPQAELNDNDIDDMYERYIANQYISNKQILIGAQ